jgi:hypothetical protein
MSQIEEMDHIDARQVTTSGQKLNGEVGGSGDTQLEKERKKETKHKHDDPGFEGKVKEEGLMKRNVPCQENNETKNN